MASINTLRDCVREHAFLKVLRVIEGGLSVFCNQCAISFDVTRSNHAAQHIQGKKHQKNTALKRPAQMNIVTVPSKKRTEDTFNRELAEVWIGAGLPISVFQNQPLRTFLEKGFGRACRSGTFLFYSSFVRQ